MHSSGGRGEITGTDKIPTTKRKGNTLKNACHNAEAFSPLALQGVAAQANLLTFATVEILQVGNICTAAHATWYY